MFTSCLPFALPSPRARLLRAAQAARAICSLGGEELTAASYVPLLQDKPSFSASSRARTPMGGCWTVLTEYFSMQGGGLSAIKQLHANTQDEGLQAYLRRELAPVGMPIEEFAAQVTQAL
jgi:hypothetical protein